MQLPFSNKDGIAVGVIGLFCLYLFRDIVLSGHLLIGDEFLTFYLGMKKFLYDQVRLHHEIPYWNPNIFGGMPFWAHFESTIFYPLGFLFYLVSPEKAYGYTMFLHVFLAGFFMYLLVRSLGVSAVGGFVASAVFACNGYMMAILYLGHMSTQNRHGTRFAYKRFPLWLMKSLSLVTEEVVYPLRYAQWYCDEGNGYDFASNADLADLERIHPLWTFERELEFWGINDIRPSRAP